MRSQSSGTDTSTLYSLRTGKCLKIQLILPRSSLCSTVRGSIHILRELWTQDIDEPEVKSSYQYVLDLRERLNDTLKLAKEQLESSQARQKKHFDKKTKARCFSPGDKVLVLLPTDANKLLVQWKEPYDIINSVGLNDYKVKINGKKKTLHANLLKK